MSQSMMSVSSLNTKLKSLIESTFINISVEGEVSSVTYHTSGHLYFSIKDSDSSIKCVMWKSSVSRLKFKIEVGMHIVIDGSVGVYTPRGEYQLYAKKIEPYGKGALALAYEQLKEKLKEKGYFSQEHKKSMPKFFNSIALVTAKDSAALHDMLKVIEHRWPMLNVCIVDTLVQGEGASSQIANSLKYADSLKVDVVVVGRGGGSTEDLWAFNEEAVANAIFSMTTPVVSAVGHEVDTLISDFVADLRAPTPSAAMEMILPDKNEVMYGLEDMKERFITYMSQQLLKKTQMVKHQEDLLLNMSPLRKLELVSKEFVSLTLEYKRVMKHKLNSFATDIPTIKNELVHSLNRSIAQKEKLLEFMSQKMELNNPTLEMKKGWAQVVKDGKKINLDDIKQEDKFTVFDGQTKVEALCLTKS